jgi:hypothetical protein
MQRITYTFGTKCYEISRVFLQHKKKRNSENILQNIVHERNFQELTAEKAKFKIIPGALEIIFS